MKIILFTKDDKPTERIVEYLKKRSDSITIYHGKRGDNFPKEAFEGTQDILVSYLSPWIIPQRVLDKTRLWNINFHPAPPEYPGIGCFNFAIYNNEKTYGVVAHLMNNKVDSGKIIAVKRFPLLESDSVYSLSIKSYEHMMVLFFEVMDFVLDVKRLPDCNEVWRRRPYTRKELNELCEIDLSMTEAEVKRRIKATTYPNMPGAYIKLQGDRL